VVFGHVVSGLLGANLAGEQTDSLKTINATIYSFHMPLFFILAGVFAPKTIGRSRGEFWSDKFSVLIYPFILWSLLQSTIQVALSDLTNTKFGWKNYVEILYNPPMQFWFLYCLLLCFVIYRVLYLLKLGTRSLLIVGILLHFGFLGLVLPPIVLRLGAELWFFAFGAVFTVRILKLTESSSFLLMLLGALGLGALVGLAPYLALGPDQLRDLLGVCCGTTFVFCSSILLCRWKMRMGLNILGKYSLEIYLAHVLMYAGARIFLIKICHTEAIPVHLIFGTFVGIFGSLALINLLHRLRIKYAFRGPRWV
jgi:fucose 4-O-acetylase-like acetyltransferase